MLYFLSVYLYGSVHSLHLHCVHFVSPSEMRQRDVMEIKKKHPNKVPVSLSACQSEIVCGVAACHKSQFSVQLL